MATSKKRTKPTSLTSQLHAKRIEWPPNQHRFFVPNCVLNQLLTIEKIESELARIHGNHMTGLSSIAEKVFESAPKLFAILVWGEFEERLGPYSICNFLKHGITDLDLPFHRYDQYDDFEKGDDFLLCRKNQNSPADVMNDWSEFQQMNFYGEQWVVLAPVFEADGNEIPCFKFNENVVLPFRKDYENDLRYQISPGGFSHVWPVRIVAEHQKLYHPRGNEDPEPLLAIKQLNSKDEAEFEREGSMLGLIANRKHKHLVELLATYSYKGKNHLLFPFAEANLRTFWDAVPKPYHNRVTHLWVLNQMTGIADALKVIHLYNTSPASGKSAGKKGPAFTRFRTGGKEQVVSIESGEEQFGRHGDLKPENILWRGQEKSTDGHGILIITDLGLGEFHRKVSRSKVSPVGLGGSQTYVPPELELQINVSRAFDIWCLGCVYLEFLVWLLKGNDELEKFHQARDGPTLDQEIYDDAYYSLRKSRRGKYAIVNPAVVHCINSLRNHPRSSRTMREVLDLVEHKMLAVEPKKRIGADELNRTLYDIYGRAKEDRELLRGSEEDRGFRKPGAPEL